MLLACYFCNVTLYDAPTRCKRYLTAGVDTLTSRVVPNHFRFGTSKGVTSEQSELGVPEDKIEEHVALQSDIVRFNLNSHALTNLTGDSDQLQHQIEAVAVY